jgi:hypothetical protein
MNDELKIMSDQEKISKNEPIFSTTVQSYGLYLVSNQKSTRSDRISSLLRFLDSTR